MYDILLAAHTSWTGRPPRDRAWMQENPLPVLGRIAMGLAALAGILAALAPLRRIASRTAGTARAR